MINDILKKDIKHREFDLWYDEQIKEIEKKLPDPCTYEKPVIYLPVLFSEFELIHIEEKCEPKDTIEIHTISFSKKYIPELKKYIWIRDK